VVVKYREVKGRYLDSIILMAISRDLEGRKGVIKAGVMVMTKENIETFHDIGFDLPSTAGSSSIWIAVEAEDDKTAEDAIAFALEEMDKDQTMVKGHKRVTLDVLRDQFKEGDFPVLFISTPEEYVAGIANTALDQGVNLHIFSSNVPTDVEKTLKNKGREKGLLVMGPDAGTTIIHGKGLGFANKVRFGDIGIVGSSGTGIQEISVLLHTSGLGVESALGVGSNDMKKEIGGISTLQALALLDDVHTIFVIAKKPDPVVRKAVIDRIKSRPSVFVSLGDNVDERIGKTYHTGSIDDAVNTVLRDLGREEIGKPAAPKRIASGARKLLRGFFVGGSLCYQAQAILKAGGTDVYSNAPLDVTYALPQDWDNVSVCVDTGAEEYVKGRPHPMIDPEARNALLVKESARPDVAVLLFDVLLGYGSAMNPLEGLAGMVKGPVLVTSICGTPEDKQGYDKIRKELDSLGVNVTASAGQAAWYAAQVMKGVKQ
jgi:FdrA protein